VYSDTIAMINDISDDGISNNTRGKKID